MIQMKDLEVDDEFFYRGVRYRKTSMLGLILGFINCIELPAGKQCHFNPYRRVLPA